MKYTRKSALLIVAVVVAALSLASCSSSSSKSSKTTSAAAPSSSAAPQSFFDLLPANIQQSKVLTVVGDLQSPLRMQDAGGPLTGVQPDFIAALAPLLGVKIEQPVIDSFANIKVGLEAGRYDFAWGGLADSAAAEKTLDIITWVTANPTFVFAATSNFTKPTDLCGKKLAKLAGSVPLTAAFASLNTLCTSSGQTAPTSIDLAARADLQLAVQSGRVDAYGTTPFDGGYTIQQAPTKWKQFSATTAPFVISNLGVAVKKGNADLTNAILAAMQYMWTNGTYAKIMKKWNLQAVSVPAPLLNASVVTPTSAATSSSAPAPVASASTSASK